jgi:N-acetylneuraminic acid mutarotase
MHTQAASLLLDGRVLVSGGYSSLSDTAPSLADAYIYDPVADVWFPTGSMRTARAQHRMLTLPDGRVLAAGGLDISGQLLTGTELFDPATGAWTPTGDLPVAVWWPAAAVLPDGTVLFAGGATNVDGTATTATCEIYSPPPPSH